MEDKAQFSSPQEEIQYLEQRILEKRKALEGKEHREVVSQVIKEHSDAVAAPAPSPSASAQSDDALPSDVAYLVQTAFQDGITDAVRKVRQTHNPYLIDAFHDALVDRFLDEMKKKGILSAHG